VRVIWDDAKNRINRKKHGVSFEEASVLFTRGDDYLEIFDDAHSDEEDRFIAIGPIVRGVGLVVFAERDEEPYAFSARAGRRSGRRTSIGPIFKGGHYDGDS
jgi:hypothetical protein